MQFDPEAFGHAMGAAIRGAVDPLKAEIAALREQLKVAKMERDDLRQVVANAPAAKDGKDADEVAIAARVTDVVKADLAQWKSETQAGIKVPELPDIQEIVDRAVSDAVKTIPAPKDGKSLTLDDVRPLIETEVKACVAGIPPAKDGKDIDPAEVERMVREAVFAIPAPKDGKSITLDDVRPILDDAIESMKTESLAAIDGAVKSAVSAIAPAKDGKDGANGKDGIGLAGFLIDRDGNLIATTTAGEAKNLGPVIGKDGLSLESFTMEYVADTHEIVIRAMAAGRTQEIRYPAGGIRGKGYWREGFKAKAGDAWTHEGSLWVATKDTETKPGTDSSAWFMAARHGKDGETVVRKVRSGPQPPIKLDDSGAEK